MRWIILYFRYYNIGDLLIRVRNLSGSFLVIKIVKTRLSVIRRVEFTCAVNIVDIANIEILRCSAALLRSTEPMGIQGHVLRDCISLKIPDSTVICYPCIKNPAFLYGTFRGRDISSGGDLLIGNGAVARVRKMHRIILLPDRVKSQAFADCQLVYFFTVFVLETLVLVGGGCGSVLRIVCPTEKLTVGRGILKCIVVALRQR